MKLQSRVFVIGIALLLIALLVSSNAAHYRAYAAAACSESFETVVVADFENGDDALIQLPGGGGGISNATRSSFKQESVTVDAPFSGKRALHVNAAYASTQFGSYDLWMVRMPPLPLRGIALDRKTHISLAWRGNYLSFVAQVQFNDGTRSALYYTDAAGPRLPNTVEDALRANNTWKVITTPDLYEWAKQQAKTIGASTDGMYILYAGINTVSPNPFDATIDRMVVWRQSLASCGGTR